MHRKLEAMLDCQIATTSDLSLLRMSISRPNESLAEYPRVSQPYDTSLCSTLRAKFGDLELLSKIFAFAREATSQLGEWCADELWRFALAEEELRKGERKIERKFNRDAENKPIELLDTELGRLREARQIVRDWAFSEPTDSGNNVSHKVLLLQKYLSKTYERPTGIKCIIFVKRRYTARLLHQLLRRHGTPHLRLDLLIGTRYAELGDIKTTFRQQVLTLMRFRKGDVNCLVC